MLAPSKTFQAALGAFILSTESANARVAPWTCAELEMATDPYYRMFPAFLSSAQLEDVNTHVQEHVTGRCFQNIKVFADFKMNAAETELKAKVTFDLNDNLSLFCMEHLQVSTAFTDYYDFYLMKG